MTKVGKRLAKAVEGLDRDRAYPIDEAVGLLKSFATTKFDETVEIAMNLGVDPRHADQMVRGVVSLPNGTGRTVRVGVFARGDNADAATASAEAHPAAVAAKRPRRRLLPSSRPAMLLAPAAKEAPSQDEAAGAAAAAQGRGTV